MLTILGSLISLAIIAQVKVFEGKIIVGTAASKLIGKDISEVVLIDLDGKEISFSFFNGSYLYVDFWFSACKPCIAEIPASKELEEMMENENIVFVNVSFDISEDKWKKTIDKYKISGENLWVNPIENMEYFNKEYNMSSFPKYWIVSPEGLILHPDAGRPSDYIKAEGLLIQDIETVSNLK